MRKAKWVRLVAGVFALSIVLAACSSDDSGDSGGTTGGTTGATTGSTSTGGGGGDAITIEGFAFNPSTITVSGPTDVTITNKDGSSHTFTTDDGSIDQEIAAGESATVTIDVAASTGFHCRFHPQMTGTIEVG
jgi:plastocyanin